MFRSMMGAGRSAWEIPDNMSPRREERPQTVFKIIRPDDVVFIPAGTQHSLSNPLELFENYAHGGERFDFVVDEE